MPPVLQLTSAEARPIADYLPSSTAQIDWFLRAYPLVMSHTCGVPPTAAMAAGRR